MVAYVAVCVTAAIGLGAAGCATVPPNWTFSQVDPRGDTRLVHPEHPGMDGGSFDLTGLTLSQRGSELTVQATFVSPVRELDARPARDRAVTMVPMTLDVYLDFAPGGHVEALPGRGFRFPASDGWEKVLVVSGLADLNEDDLIHANRVAVAGRTLKAVFDLGSLVLPQTTGVQVVVMATAMSGDGRVRGVGTHGDCRVWDDYRCVLIGQDPPVIDALAEVQKGRPVAMNYPEGTVRETVARTPVVFVRGKLVGAAPVGPEVSVGQLGTLYGADGAAIATAVVLSVVGDTASLEVVGDGVADGAVSIELSAPGDRP